MSKILGKFDAIEGTLNNKQFEACVTLLNLMVRVPNIFEVLDASNLAKAAFVKTADDQKAAAAEKLCETLVMRPQTGAGNAAINFLENTPESLKEDVAVGALCGLVQSPSVGSLGFFFNRLETLLSKTQFEVVTSRYTERLVSSPKLSPKASVEYLEKSLDDELMKIR